MVVRAKAAAKNVVEFADVERAREVQDKHENDGQIGSWLHRRFLQAAVEKNPERKLRGSKVHTLTPRDQQAIRILNHAIEHLMGGLPADTPDTVHADLERCDMQAAAILARVSREFFVPTSEPSSEQLLRVTLMARMRAIAARFGLLQESRAGR